MSGGWGRQRHVSAGKRDWAERYGPWGVVTGASDGIGQALAIELARRGLNLVLVARRRDRLEALAQELQDDFGIATRVTAGDLGVDEEVDRVLSSTEDLEIGLFAGSAGFGTSGPFLGNDLGAELGMLDVNCRAVVTMTHHYGRRFLAQGHGGLILLSSLLAFQGTPRASHYAATKAFIQTLAEGLALELRPHGVDVLASAPGPVSSGFAARANMEMGNALTPTVVASQTANALGRRTTVRPGWLSKLLEWSLSTLPRVFRSRVVGKVMLGMTKHQPT